MAGKFKPGQSGNPSGRPKGIPDKRVAMRELLTPYAGDLIGKTVELALSGDTTALRICIDRLVPPVKEEAIEVTLPKIACAEDCTNAQAAVLNAVAEGEMLPGVGKLMSDLIDAQRRAYETNDLAKRMAAVEEALEKGTPHERT